MFKNIENLKIENIHKGVSKKGGSVRDRKKNSFILRVSGHIRYSFEDYHIDHTPDTLIFLPKGSSYDTDIIEPVCDYVAIKFDADIENATPAIYPFEKFGEADEFYNNISELWKFGDKADHYRCYCVFYSLLAYLENLEKHSYADIKKHSLISPAMSYLKTHIYDTDLKIDTLYNLCNISGTYFRKIFQANYSQSPQKYILSKRLSHAKIILDSGDCDTVSELAESVGYSDPLYFSRAFKKKYGEPPSKFLKE